MKLFANILCRVTCSFPSYTTFGSEIFLTYRLQRNFKTVNCCDQSTFRWNFVWLRSFVVGMVSKLISSNGRITHLSQHKIDDEIPRMEY